MADTLAVTIGGISCQVVTPVGNFAITCLLNATLTPGAMLSVAVSNRFGSDNDVVAVYGAPSVAAVNPSIVPSGSTTMLTITGTNLGINAWNDVRAVTVGGAHASVVNAISSVEVQIGLPLSPLDPGSYDVVVETWSGGLGNAYAITIGAPPNVTSVAPTAGPLAGGAVITIQGTSFRMDFAWQTCVVAKWLPLLLCVIAPPSHHHHHSSSFSSPLLLQPSPKPFN